MHGNDGRFVVELMKPQEGMGSRVLAGRCWSGGFVNTGTGAQQVPISRPPGMLPVAPAHQGHVFSGISDAGFLEELPSDHPG